MIESSPEAWQNKNCKESNTTLNKIWNLVSNYLIMWWELYRFGKITKIYIFADFEVDMPTISSILDHIYIYVLLRGSYIGS